MKDSFDIVYNKELGCWEEKKEPYTTIEIATEKDFELLKQKLQFYDKNYDETENYKKEIKKLKEQLAEYKKPIDKFIKDREVQAVKKFAEELKKRSYCDNDFMDGKWHRYVFVDEIDELLKEYESGK